MDNVKQAEIELSFIKKVIEDSKKITVDNGMGFILWGILGVAGIILTYADYYLKIGIGSLYIWIGIFAIGIVYIILLSFKAGKREKVKTLAGDLLGAVWIGCLLASGFMLIIPLIAKEFPANITLSSILFVIGVGYFVSSTIFNYKWIRYNGYAWWLGGFLNLLFVFPHSQMIFLGSLLIFFQIIPGLVLYKKWKKEINLKQLNQ